MRDFKIHFVICLFFYFVLSGCSNRFKLNDEDLEFPSDWPNFRGDKAGSGSVPGGDFNGLMDILWETKSNDKPLGHLTLHYGKLVYPGARKKLKIYDQYTGRYMGSIKLKGTPQSGLAVDGKIGVIALSPKKNRLLGIDLSRNKVIWKQPLKDAISGSIIVEERLFAGSSEGSLIALEVSDGNPIWQVDFDNRLVGGVTYDNMRLFVQDDHRIIHVLKPDDGTELSRIEIKGISAGAVVAGDKVYTSDIEGNLYACNPASGEIVWETNVGGPVWSAPVLAEGILYVGHSGGEAVAVSSETGAILWRFNSVDVIKVSPVVAGQYVVCGTMSGQVFSINRFDGRLKSKIELPGAIDVAPITDGRCIYVATQKGKIFCIGEKNEQYGQDTE